MRFSLLNNINNDWIINPLLPSFQINLNSKMPIENMEEEGLAKIPDLRIAQKKFQLQSVERFQVVKAAQKNITGE